MNEYVHVEFIAKDDEVDVLVEKIEGLGENFQPISDLGDYINKDFSIGNWFRISGRISSEYASIIKLQDAFLSDRMRISYISDELKNKYRK